MNINWGNGVVRRISYIFSHRLFKRNDKVKQTKWNFDENATRTKRNENICLQFAMWCEVWDQRRTESHWISHENGVLCWVLSPTSSVPHIIHVHVLVLVLKSSDWPCIGMSSRMNKKKTHTLFVWLCVRARTYLLSLCIYIFVLPMCVYVASRHEWYIYTMLYYILYITLSACVKPSDWYIVWTYSRAIHKAIISHMYICTNIL